MGHSGKLGIVLKEKLAEAQHPAFQFGLLRALVAAFGNAALCGGEKHLQLSSGSNSFYSLASSCMSQFGELLMHNKI